LNKNDNSKKAIFLIALILISALSVISLEGVNAATISFTCAADLKTTNAGVSQSAQYTVIINNTGSAKMGSANITIPAGYTNLVASSVALTGYPSGQTWTATIIAQPTTTSNGTIVLQGSANGLDHNQIITASFYVKNPAVVDQYQWLISANQNTGQGGQDYQVVVVAFNQLITPAITTELSIAPSSTLIAGSTIYDTALLTGTTPDATGTVTYTLYRGESPNGVYVYESQVGITGSDLPNVPNSAVSPALTIAGQYYFLATYSGEEGKNSPATGVPEAFTVQPNELVGFEFSPISNQIAGNPFLITIKAVDEHGNTISNYAQTNTLSATEGITLSPTSITFANGVFCQPVTITTAATSVTLTVTDAQDHTGSSNAFDVAATVPLKLEYTTGKIQTLSAGQISSIITVQLQDAGNNPVVVTSQLELSLSTNSSAGIFYSDAAGTSKTSTITIPAGQSSTSFYYKDTTAGTPAIVVSNPTANSAITYFTITPALAGVAKFALSAPESVNAGQSFTTTITAQDSYGNKVPSYTGTVKISTTDYQAVLPSNFALTGGEGSFTLILKTIGVQTITATALNNNAITGSATTQVTVDSASSTHFVVTAPAVTDAGASMAFTVTAKDQYGNTVTGYSGTIHLTSTDNQATLPADTGLTHGTASLSATLKTAGTQTITATDTVNSEITGTSNNIQVNANTHQLSTIIISPDTATIKAGESQAFTAQGYDPYNNPLEDKTNQVTWSIDSGTGTYTWTANSVQVNKAGTWTVTATLGSLSDTASLTVTANPAQLDHITISPKTATITVGESKSYTVEAFDTLGNSLGDVTSSTTFTATGGATVTGNSIHPSTSGTYTVTATYSGKSDTATLTANAQSSSSSSSSSSTSNTQPTPKTYTITFTEQGLPNGQEWSVTFNGVTKASNTPTISFSGIKVGDYTWSTSAIVNGNETTQYALDGSATGSMHVATVTSQTVSYKTQYYLTIDSAMGNPVGQGWYDAGSTATFNVDQQGTDSSGTQYQFAGWTGTGDGSYSGQETTQTVTMNNAITETARWEQATSLYTVAGAALLIFLLLLLALLLAWRRRRKKKPQNFPVKELDTE
jgi:hypothetical protein